jgi:hypothetical protein
MRRHELALLLAAILALPAFPAFAASSYQVAYGATVTVNEWSVCYQVTNNHASGLAIFVPTNTSTEWAAFYNHLPAGVTTGSCEIDVTLSNSTNVNISTLFTSAQWTSTTPKKVIIPAGVTIGATSSATPAIQTGTGWSGTLTLQNAGTIAGAGGTANSGVGGTAVLASQATLYVVNTGTIEGGGGGGGAGGGGDYSGTTQDGPLFSQSGAYYEWVYNGIGNSIFWNDTNPFTATYTPGSGAITSYLAADGYTYYKGVNQTASYYAIYRTHPATIDTTGGAGGAGGRGQGYDGANASGSGGAAGGTNAGTGGTGGTGATYGNTGNTGATGASGNNGAGTAGTGGGLAGLIFQTAANVSQTNSGTELGR